MLAEQYAVKYHPSYLNQAQASSKKWSCNWRFLLHILDTLKQILLTNLLEVPSGNRLLSRGLLTGGLVGSMG